MLRQAGIAALFFICITWLYFTASQPGRSQAAVANGYGISNGEQVNEKSHIFKYYPARIFDGINIENN